MPLVYPHHRMVASAYLRRERNPGVMQATSLLHELYLRLLNQHRTASPHCTEQSGREHRSSSPFRLNTTIIRHLHRLPTP